MSDNKTEQPTAARRKKAREQGSVLRSRELPGVIALAVAAGVTIQLTRSSISSWKSLYLNMLSATSNSDFDAGRSILFLCSVETLRWVVPILLSTLLGSLFASLIHGGLSLAPAALKPKIARLNPGEKVKQIASPIGLSNLLKSLLPFTAIFFIVLVTVRDNWQLVTHMSAIGLDAFVSSTKRMIFEALWKSGLVLLVWSAVDYALTWQKTERDLKMSKDELRRESKETEGNPLVKQRIRSLRRAMRRRHSVKAAATATVIVTNPTHYAVALKYESDMAVPLVVAKGLGLVAEKIKQIGRDNGIVVIESKILAQSLYKSVEVGDSIPSKLYQAVAEILVVVFQVQKELRQREAERRARNASGLYMSPEAKL